MNKKLLFFWLSFFILFSSCATYKEFIPKEEPEITFEKTPEYSVDLSNIQKPEKPNFLYGIQETNETVLILPKDEQEKSDVVILTNSELGKINALVKLNVGYKRIIEQQEVLVNQYIRSINSLKEFVELERLKTKEYQKLWVNTENQRRYEEIVNKNEQTMDFIENTVIKIILGGVILALSL